MGSTASISLTFKMHHRKYEVYDTGALILCTDVLRIPVSSESDELFVSARAFSWLITSSSTESTFWAIRVLCFLLLPGLQSTVGPDWFDEASLATYSKTTETSFCLETPSLHSPFLDAKRTTTLSSAKNHCSSLFTQQWCVNGVNMASIREQLFVVLISKNDISS